ncbi:MAG: LacI family transcriptional regulator [Acidobacteria bacterium]|nr:LacI family transcriptional regulator [Acidobacteriota bacterium]
MLVDQFGYLPAMRKVAVISDPQTGYNAAVQYAPGAVLEVRCVSDNSVVFTGSVVAWRNGETHAQSGDRVWQFDFSNVNCVGEHYLYDPANDTRSHIFSIGADVYRNVLRHSVRMFFYQRCHHAKRAPFAETNWTDEACHLTDLRARPIEVTINDKNNVRTERDLSGGWHDAGDYNKYTILTAETLSDLLFAYERNRMVFTDDFGVPESGNGIPDVLDEIKWELDWLLKMQNADGSVLTKLSATDFAGAAPPSADATVRYYGAASTSATLAAAVSFAHASLTYQRALPTYSKKLLAAARKAWAWAAANPRVLFNNAGFGSESTEVDDYQRSMFKLATAIYLFAATGETAYRDYVEANLAATHALQWDYWHCYEALTQDALLFYASWSSAPLTTATRIRNSKQSAINGPDFLTAFTNQSDAYGAFLKDDCYTWGSNRLKAHVGTLFLAQQCYNLDPARAALYRNAGAAQLHYLHGVNPMGTVYLTNMYSAGAEKCVNEIFHRWFRDGSVWDSAVSSPRGPAPGYVPGGPHAAFAPSPEYTGTELWQIRLQPAQKAYKDWNGDWPEDSWQLTEPAIYYQAAYVNLLATTINQFQNVASASGVCPDQSLRSVARLIR